MGRALGLLISVLAYFCVATVIALLIGVWTLWSKGLLSDEKMLRIVAVMHDDPAAEAPKKEGDPASTESTEQPSWEDRERPEGMQLRQFELREQALDSARAQLQFEQTALAQERQQLDSVRTAFNEELKKMSEGVVATGEENVRTIWENIKPKQAKEQMLLMLEAQETEKAVSLLSAMPIAKRAKIAGEFKTPDEAQKLAEILKLLREGVPQLGVVDGAREKLDQLNQAAP